MTFVIYIVCGYLIGSIPTAYIVVRSILGEDIRKKGSGNVGAYNAYDVTHSKKAGILVGCFDAIKGFLPVSYIAFVLHGDFWLQASMAVAIMIGHNYSVWLKFRGGRGLASAAGGLLPIGFGYIIIWCLVWFIIFKRKHHILQANVTAISLTPILLLLIPSLGIQWLMVSSANATEYRLFSFIISGILLLSHQDVIRGIFKNQTN